jgi:hypothetical protein
MQELSLNRDKLSPFGESSGFLLRILRSNEKVVPQQPESFAQQLKLAAQKEKL